MGGKGPKIIIAKDKELSEEEKKKLKKAKKKWKSKKNPEAEESVHETKGMSKALAYLKTWDEDRDNWKFEKCRQIWLLHNMYDSSKVADKLFPSLLRYIGSIRGAMRHQTLQAAQQKLPKERKIEEETEESKSVRLNETGDNVTENELKRAEDIIESLSE